MSRLASERGVTLEEAIAQLRAPGRETARLAIPPIGVSRTSAHSPETVRVVRRRSPAARAAPLPDELIPTKERLLDSFSRECARIGKTPDESWRRAVVRLRITKKFNDRGIASDHPIDTMEEAAGVCARLELFPEVLKVEFGQTAYVGFDEDGKRPEFREFLDDVLAGIYDGYALVALRIDRLARTVAIGSLLIERCLRAGIDIVEIAHAEDYDRIPSLANVKYLYIDKFKEGQQEWEKMSARQREKRARKIRKGEIAGNVTGIGHLQQLETIFSGNKVVTKVAAVLPDPLYQPYVEEWCERLSNGETRNAIALDMNTRVAAGTAPTPPPRIAPGGEELICPWHPQTISVVVSSPRLIGCQRDASGKLVRSPRIAPLVSEDLWYRANAELELRKREIAAKIKRISAGPKPSKIGVGILTCGCGDTAQSRGSTYGCAKRKIGLNPPVTRHNGSDVASDGRSHFQIEGSVVDSMLRDVTVAVLDRAPEIAANGAALAARRDRRSRERDSLRERQGATAAARERVLQLFIAGDISEREKDVELGRIDSELRTIATEIAATIEGSPKNLLETGETWASRWDTEYARPDGAGIPWLQAVLREVWERIDVAVGPDYRGRRVFHEGRFTFIGRPGYSVRPEVVAEIAQRRYTERMQVLLEMGYGDLSQKAKDKLFELHFEKRVGAPTILREMIQLAADDPDFAPRQPLTDELRRRSSTTWTRGKVMNAVKMTYAERGVEFVPHTSAKITRADRELLRKMVQLHGHAAAARLANALGRRRPDGKPYTTSDVHHAIRADCGTGRPMVLDRELVDLIEELQLQGLKLAEIQSALAAEPNPTTVSISTISRRLVERRALRTAQDA